MMHQSRFNFMREARIWYSRDPTQETLPSSFENEIVLSEDFFPRGERRTLKQYIQTLVKRAKALEKEKIDPIVDNILKITGDGFKAALYLRLVGLNEDPGHDTKLKRAIRQIFSVWQQTAAERGTQLVFCDISTPDPQR